MVRNDLRNIAIIAHVDHGKTTLVDLILRTYNVPDNSIFIDGYDINTLPIKLVRQYAAYVPQDNFLFSGTIKENIIAVVIPVAVKSNIPIKRPTKPLLLVAASAPCIKECPKLVIGS